MATVQVADFGTINGVRVFRVNGEKQDLEQIIEACRKEDAEFYGSPELEHVRHGGWTLLLKLKVAQEIGDVV